MTEVQIFWSMMASCFLGMWLGGWMHYLWTILKGKLYDERF